MQKMIINILDNYLNAKNKSFGNNDIANYIREEAKLNIETKCGVDKSKYIVEASPGKGRWADVPWIAIFDREITNSATKGYYIVYLFCADMSGVYISLNQGWTYFKEKYGIKDGKEKIRIVSDAWKVILSSTLTDFSFDHIKLKGISKNSNLAEGYELGHICGKFYEKGNIPDSNELIEDLRNLVGVYRELKGRLKDSSIEKTNNYLIVNHDLGLLEGNDQDKLNDVDELDLSNIEDTIEDLSKSILIEVNTPQFLEGKDNEMSDFTPRKVDFLKKAKNQKKLGFAGEAMVLKYERDRLIAAGKKKLAERVRHVSKEDGDGAGYDILSFEINGDQKYIEVKTTTGNESAPFMITAKELKFSELNSKNYYLYRVFDFNKQDLKGKLYVLKGDISKQLKLNAQQFIANGINIYKDDEIL